MRDGSGTLAGTIAVVYIRREYGVPLESRTIVDIGANMGCFTLFAASKIPTAKVFSYEPEPNNFSILDDNIQSNSLGDRIAPFKMAVASTSGAREMTLGESPLNSLISDFTTGRKSSVTCTTLHSILEANRLDRIDLLKVNCEGAEYEIFGNLSEDDLSRISKIRLEYHNLGNDGQSGRWLYNWFHDKGFRIIRFTNYRNVSGFIWADRQTSP
jgi:FkbM family methyltransferase